MRLAILSIVVPTMILAGCHRSNPDIRDSAILQEQLVNGWNTWNTASVLTQVLLPEGFALDLQLKDGESGDILKEALIGREDYGSREQVIPGPHAYDGSYTELELKWRNVHIQVQSASLDNGLYLLIKPIRSTPADSLLIIPKMLWGKEGHVTIDKNLIYGQTPGNTIKINVDGNHSASTSTKLIASLDKPTAISSGAPKSLEDIEKVISQAKMDFEKGKSKYLKTRDSYEAMQTVLAWNCVYDSLNNRIITPVSRDWCNGSWVLFEWDTYFASYMLALDNKDLAYANTIAITGEITRNGFVPNNSQPGIKSEDRSEPPVGSLVVQEIYKRYKEKWFLNEVFDELLSWNRWWANNRDIGGYLCYGTDPYDYGNLKHRSLQQVGKIKAAKWESGLDNSPMYDEAVFDTVSHRMMLADVGLMSLYIADCRSLSEIAGVLGKKEIDQELAERADKYSKKLATLWNDEIGIYLNKDLVTGKFSYRLSPTLFYPLLAKVPNQAQAERMMKEHFYNPGEFWGEFIMPSIARNDQAFADNMYWRGRIWAPMNFLVYLGIRNYKLPDAQQDMVLKSRNLLLKSWLNEKHVYENYNAETGKGDDTGNWSDKFYHWGALLGFIDMIDQGYLQSP